MAEAEWSTAFQNDLPDSSFAYVEPGEKDKEGKTVPRTKRHLVYKDADGKVDHAHVVNALARLPTTQIPAAAKASARRKLVAAAKSIGVEVSDEDAKESLLTPSALPASVGKDKIATMKLAWLKDDAISLNGRQYPREAVNTLIQSAQLQLSQPDPDPLTCYISHAAADEDNSLLIVGKITEIWRDGPQAWASIDLADTSAGRDMATLAAHKYIRTISLRASNAEIQHPKGGATPTVGGSSLRLDGIDFTASPGIPTAKIQQVALAENAREGPQRLHEVFTVQAPLIEMEQKEAPMDPIKEADQGGNMAGGYSPTSGNAPSVDGAPSGGEYGQRMYKKPDDTSGGQMAGMDPTGELKEAHDRAAMIQGRSCAPSRESADWGRAFKSMDADDRKRYVQTLTLLEAGRSISARNDKHLDVIHDSLARHLGMAGCVGEASKPKAAPMQPANDGMDDGDDDDQQSAKPKGGLNEHHKEQQEMPPTPEEAARILEAAGYKIEKPKSTEEQLQERLDAMKAEQAAQLEALKVEQAKHLEEQQKKLEEQTRTLIAQATPDPQRKSLVLGANIGESGAGRQQPLRGKYLQEKIKSLDWERMAYDRMTPLPTDTIPLDLLMREFEHMYALSYDDWAKRVYNIEPVYADNR